jgi:hypothetical protein
MTLRQQIRACWLREMGWPEESIALALDGRYLPPTSEILSQCPAARRAFDEFVAGRR